MNRNFARIAALLAITTIPATSAQAACWSASAASAASVQTLGTMLMVGALRCRASGSDFLADYGQFVQRNNALLSGANNTLKGHFSSAGGINAHDRYVTSIANRFGAGVAGMGCADMKRLASLASKSGANMSYLANLADEANIQPNLPGGRCMMTASDRR